MFDSLTDTWATANDEAVRYDPKIHDQPHLTLKEARDAEEFFARVTDRLTEAENLHDHYQSVLYYSRDLEEKAFYAKQIVELKPQLTMWRGLATRGHRRLPNDSSYIDEERFGSRCDEPLIPFNVMFPNLPPFSSPPLLQENGKSE
jgi:hypothetical protein